MIVAGSRIFRFPRAVAPVWLFLLLMAGCSGDAPLGGTPEVSVTPVAVLSGSPEPAGLLEIPLPESVSFGQVTAGKWHACGLQDDGTALCWGSRLEHGEQDAPPGVRFRKLAAGLQFTCGLRDDGAVLCWGNNAWGKASPPEGRFVEVAAGRNHACALDTTGAAICWGEGYDAGGEIEAAGVAFTAIGSGFGHSCGLTVARDLLCWQNKEMPESTPGPFRGLGVGLRHSCALRDDGSAFCRGENYSWQATPPPTAFTAIAAGWSHSCGITGAGMLECWGSAVAGAPGLRLDAPEGEFTAISVGWRHSCGLRPGGYAVCWEQSDISASAGSLNLTEAFGGRSFEQPVELLPWPGGGLAVVERKGVINVYANADSGGPPIPTLDLSANTDCCRWERGMLSAAVDPEFDRFPYLYVYYHARVGDDALVARLSRFDVVDGYALGGSELVVLEFANPARVHQGGAIRFGADGMLYLGLGDNDDTDNAQDLSNLHGKIIRIDVRGATEERPYAAPEDNPFADTPGARREIWAYGLRNPWRMAFDGEGRLLAADVGSVGPDAQEEVSIATAGANLGWPVFEGSHCHKSSADFCADFAAGAVAPIFAEGHRSLCVIVGGVTVAWLGDGFVFGDFCSGRIRLLLEDAGAGWRARELAQASGAILSIGMGRDEAVYVLRAGGPIMRLQRDGE